MSIQLHLRELDLKRDVNQDLSCQPLWDSIFEELRLGLWDVVLMSPPCSTFSRARFNYRKGGPRPLRDCVYPHGFPWLRESDRAAVRQADFFVDRCLDAIQLQINSCKHFLIEHPEDLGVTRTGAHPASIWQLSKLRDLVDASASSFALHQCHFGSASQKPTRLAGNLPSWAHLSVSWPQFDRTGHYCGPLPQCTEHEHEPLIGFNSETNAWRTTSSASYPSAFCAMLALNILSAARNETTPPAPLQPEGGHLSLPPFPPIPAGGQVSAVDPSSNLQGFPPVPPPLQNPCEASSFNLPSFDAGSWQSPCETSGSTADFNPSAGLPRSSFGDVGC